MTAPLVNPDVASPMLRRALVMRRVMSRSARTYSMSSLDDLRRLYASLPAEDVVHVHLSAEDRPSWVSRRYAGRIITATYTPAGWSS